MRNKFIKSLAILSATVGLAACGAGATSDSSEGSVANIEDKTTVDTIKENDVIRIGIFGDKPPFSYVDANGDNQGFDVEISKKIAEDLLGDSSKIEWVITEAANRVEYLETGKVDLMMANFTVTPERAEVVDFANPYMKVSIGIVSPEGEVITDVSQLEGKQLIVNKGTTAEAYFRENYPDIELLVYEQNTETFQALLDGRGAALAHDNTLIFGWIKENPGYVAGVEAIGNEDTIAPAVAKSDTALLEWVNEELDTLNESGFIAEAYEKTLAPAFSAEIDPASVLINQ